ncbi:hypothetical protein V5O48_005014 [Marasmius crinis-equi]|uniref:Glycoside hydrolase family 76 protein n=1 Tax=Marasmius crinis-equi TaxID=585013 RepID=A0ABR3FNG7_9AGAR
MHKKPSINNTLDERIALAIGAINAGITGLDSNGYFPAPLLFSKSDPDEESGLLQTGMTPGNSSLLLSQMAEFDLIAQRNEFKDKFTNIIKSVSDSCGNGTFMVLQLLEYGYAAVRGFKAYNDSSLLDNAKSVWDSGRLYTLNSTGRNDMYPSVSLEQCSAHSQDHSRSDMAGGTFFGSNRGSNRIETEIYLDGTTTAAFALLSASLAEATSNASYADAADQSLLFIKNFVNTNLNQSTIINATTCSRWTAPDPVIGPAGFLTEALTIMSLLPDSLQSHEPAINHEQWLLGVIQEAMANAIRRKDGIMTSYFNSGDAYLMRAFYQVYRRKPNLRAILNLKDLIGVQYNALIDLAKVPAKDVYSNEWIGPHPTDLLGIQGINQSMAATVLVGAIHIDDPDSNPTPSARPTSSTSRHNKVPVIVGATIGSVTLVTIAVSLVLWLLWRRRRRSKPLSEFTIDGYFSTPSAGRSAPSTRDEESEVIFVDPKGQSRLKPPRPLSQLPSDDAKTRLLAGNSRMAASEVLPLLTTEKVENSRRLTTEELVQMLNQRLQPEYWNEDEMPPDYNPSQGSCAQPQVGPSQIEPVPHRKGEGFWHRPEQEM